MKNENYLSALKQTLEELKSDFKRGEIKEEFYYKKLTGLFEDISKIEDGVSSVESKKDLKEKVTVDKSVKLGKGAKVRGDIITGEKITITRDDSAELKSIKDELSEILKTLKEEPKKKPASELLKNLAKKYKDDLEKNL